MSVDYCPVCLNANGAKVELRKGMGDLGVSCDNCGRFVISDEANEDYLETNSGPGQRMTPTQRARLSHRIRTSQRNSDIRPRIESDLIERFFRDGCPGPNPAQQTRNLIRHIGDHVSRTGQRIPSLPKSLFAIIGSPSPDFSGDLLLELIGKGLVIGAENRTLNNPPSAFSIGLTLEGWEFYEQERTGQLSGKFGFIAMKFGDTILDPFVRDVIKPAIKIHTGHDLIDMRDVSRAGIIDNIMREQIRDSAFVIVDLTHDNSGAYWEAGYAEGLGKSVIYICERAKFDAAKTHFDTNHCTTIIWSNDHAEDFAKDLVATLRRSLNLFSDSR
ncbi:hypothetical protein [Mesorhizobium sp. B2-8-5]|uniref:hypothetical protein n=1 Tax=Mesorhizobium sp. B2-8-5 TaxID=2589903 RepID=UPI001126B777|nr:hypothetical protein [Mesorhizobium sp. B2-8-5]UCI23853.1 hypothetical protein FJ430_19810 [Mesorhizobium sp. B2-8-5]